MKKILLALALILMIVTSACAVDGTYTIYGNFYKPPYGGFGIAEWTEYNAYIDIADAQIWANKTDIAGIDLTLYYLKTEIDTLSKVEAIYTKDLTDSDELASALTDYYLKTAIDSQGEVETIWSVTLSTDAERNALTYSDVGAEQADAGLTSLAGLTYVSDSFIKVTATDTYAIRTLAEVKADLDLEIGTDIQAFDNALTSISGLTYVSPSFIKLTANDTYAVRTLAEVKTDLAYQLSDMSDVGVTTPTNKYVLVADGDSWESRAIVEADISDFGTYATLTGDEVLTNKDINFVNALGTDHFYSGELDSQPVGENVVFGQLLYYDWTDVEWKLAKADAFGTAKATRIALESKANGETCLMLVKGYIRDDSAFDFGAARVFLNDDTFGACDDTAPAESGDQIFVVGEAKSADVLFFDPGKDVGEI